MPFDPHATVVLRVIARLQQERLAQGISQEKLANMAGLSRTGIRHIESGLFKPTLYSLLKIAEALRLDLPGLLREAMDAIQSGRKN